MAQDTEKKPEESTGTSPVSRTSTILKILSIVLVVALIIGSIALMFKYSRSIFNSVVAANAVATVQEQTSVAQEATSAPTETAVAARQEAIRNIVPNMTATAIAEVNATALVEANATPIPYPPNTSPVIDDSLSGNSSKGYAWETSDDPFGNCSFTNGIYQIIANYKSYFEYCRAKPITFTNFIYEAQMTIAQGDGGGLIFRADDKGNKFYHFLVNQKGTYELSVFDLTRNPNGTVLSSGSDPSINTGVNIPNIIAVVVNGNVFQLYVNHHRIAVVGDDSYNRGEIGLSAEFERIPTRVMFQNVKVWQL
jgi:hypothetical protein